jgi:hypothetical protein
VQLVCVSVRQQHCIGRCVCLPWGRPLQIKQLAVQAREMADAKAAALTRALSESMQRVASNEATANGLRQEVEILVRCPPAWHSGTARPGLPCTAVQPGGGTRAHCF